MPTHDTLLRRGKRNWNFAAMTYYGPMDRAGGRLWDKALEHLELREGERVLDIGCGLGGMLVAMRKVVGDTGHAVGVDYSPRMVAKTRKRIRRHGWTNVEVRQADASRVPQGCEEFDAAVALTSFSCMPDVAAAVALAHEALRPGGRLFVFDMRLVGDSRKVRLMRRFYRATAGFTGADVLAELRRTFATVVLLVPEHPMMTMVLATKG
jgi:ubiquinone/menaquinone biosynthesis C-methylase UbiE